MLWPRGTSTLNTLEGNFEGPREIQNVQAEHQGPGPLVSPI